MSVRRVLRDRRHTRLLEAARRGDREAFRALYRDLFTPVTAYLAVRLRPREDVEDVTSQVFHRFLERLDRFDPARGSVLGWMLTITHHVMVDHARRRRPSVPVEEGREPHDPSPDPLERLVRREEAEAVRAHLDALEPQTRRMFELRYAMDMSYREIAGVLAISEDSVKQRFSRAHRRMRVTMQEEGDGRHE